MIPRIQFAIRSFLFACAASLVTALPVAAHDPFDQSTRATAYPDRIEIVSILGAEAAKAFLGAAGLPQEKIAESLKGGGRESAVPEPLEIAPLFFDLTWQNEPVKASSVLVRSEGMEVILTLIYPRPEAGVLKFRATCYDTVPRLKRGVILVEDSAAGQLGAAMLSTTRKELPVKLPGK